MTALGLFDRIDNAPSEREHELRSPCRQCGSSVGVIRARGAQDCVFCASCGKFAYNAPRVETGRKVRSVSSVHEAIRPKQRARILERAHARCEICGKRGELHVGHVLSVKVGLELGMGLTEQQLNSDENLIAHCPECNLGQGKQPMPLWLVVGLFVARTKED